MRSQATERWVFRFERGPYPRNRFPGGGFGRGAKPPSELAGTAVTGAGSARVNGARPQTAALPR